MQHAFPFEYRASVTAKFYYDVLAKLDADTPFFTYDQEAEDYGMDPWRLRDGMDRTVKPGPNGHTYFVGDSGKELRETDIVYVQTSDLDRLGVPWVQSIEWQDCRYAKLVA